MTIGFCIAPDDYQRQPDSKWVLSFWVIPDGIAYDKAYPVNVFFSDAEHEFALSLEKRFEAPPEMAILTSIEMHDKIRAKIAAKIAERAAQLENYE